jgi:hypothetical protein
MFVPFREGRVGVVSMGLRALLRMGGGNDEGVVWKAVDSEVGECDN